MGNAIKFLSKHKLDKKQYRAKGEDEILDKKIKKFLKSNKAIKCEDNVTSLAFGEDFINQEITR